VIVGRKHLDTVERSVLYCSYKYSYKEKTMRFANVRELKNKTSEILRLAEKEEVVVTSRGKPTAIIKGVSEEDFEDYLLENNPKFLAALEKAKEEYIRFGGVSIEEYLRKRRAKHG
jgi:prevent-host-death family protein